MKKFICLTVLCLGLLCSCEPQTDILVIEKELKTIIKENGITKCTIINLYGERTYVEHIKVDFEIKNGFICINHIDEYGNTTGIQYKYNLLYLSKYEIFPWEKVIDCYFANTHF